MMILAFVLGWFVAQTTKFGLILAFRGRKTGARLAGKRERLTFREGARLYFKSGGMPSGHTASILAAAMYTGLSAGFDSPLFGILICVAITVIYDAVNVRYAVGEQGKRMNRLISVIKPEDGPVKVVEGHTVTEVVAGGVIGVLMGALVALLGG